MFLFNWVIFLLPALNFQGNHHFIFAKPGRQMLEDSKPTPKVFRWSLSLSSFLPPFLPRILESEKPTTQGQKPKSQQKPEKTPPPKQIIERADDRWMALVKGTKNQRIDVVEAWPNPVCHMTI